MASNLLLIPKKNMFIPKGKDIVNQKMGQIKSIYGKYFNIDCNYMEDGAIIVEFRNDKSGIYKDNSGNWVCVEGVVFSLNESKKLSPCEILTMFKKHRENFVNLLDGHFVIKIFDKKFDNYIICNDIIKHKTNYFSSNSEFIIVSSYSQLNTLLNANEIDYNAVNEYFWRYYILSNKSFYKNIEKLSSASYISIHEGQIKKEKYWNWPKNYTDMKFDECVSNMVESLKDTARLISNTYDNPCIDFTLGQDSRTIISSFMSQNLNFVTSTFGHADFMEVSEVKKLADKYHISNVNIKLENNSDEFSNSFFKSITLSSGEEPGYLLSRIMLMREKQLEFGNAVLNGMDGHFYKNGLWDEMYTFNFYREPRGFDINKFLNLRLLSNDYYDEFFLEKFRNVKNNSRDYFINLINDSIVEYKGSPVSIQVDKFDLEHWLNFGITTNNAINNILPSLSPLLFRRNLQLALTIPVKWKFNLSKFQREIVYRMSPELAKEKTDFGGVSMKPLNMASYIPFHFRYFGYQNKRLFNKMKSKLGFQVKSHIQEAWDYLPVYKKLFKQEEIEVLLNYSEMELASIIDKKKWLEYKKRFTKTGNPTIKDFEFILKIASLESFLKQRA